MVEIKIREVENIEKEGDFIENNKTTTITSVSVSKKFRELLDNFQLSPTEVFRKGVAVSLFDEGVVRYNTPLNNKRSEFVKEFMQKIKEDEKNEKIFEELVMFAEKIIKLKEDIL